MRIWLAVPLILAVLMVGCNRKPKEHKDQVSYTIGAKFGQSLKSQNIDLNMKMVARGIADGYKGEQTSLSDEEMQQAMTKLSGMRQEEAKKLADANKAKGDEFLAKNKNAEGIKVTESGLQYKITAPGSGPSPTLEDMVVVNYRGTLIDGTEFDSSSKRGQPAEFPIRGVIPGWTEGLQLMKKGGKAMFYIPPELAYGDRARQQIPPNATLIFDVELLDIKPAPKMPSHSKPPGPRKK
ncbi:MAG: FKBP-type peptidyl-prolyl cis-trans isomerase [Bdellovibrionales bacterium]|nr:FKBP-type peptidyl-prolyl cis-trans isomerase [Bdellovibrionales bacterium]